MMKIIILVNLKLLWVLIIHLVDVIFPAVLKIRKIFDGDDYYSRYVILSEFGRVRSPNEMIVG